MLLGRNLAEVLFAQRIDEREMAMALDHARHQRHAAAVDRRDAVPLNLIVAACDRRDAVVLDEDLARIALVVLAVPDLHVGEKIGHRRRPPPRRAASGAAGLSPAGPSLEKRGSASYRQSWPGIHYLRH